MPSRRPPSDRVRLLISDVDGTLVTPEKVLTDAALAAARRLREAGVGFTVVSSRPPRGISHLLPALGIDLPFGGFNGGSVVDPADASILEQRSLPEPAARETLAFLSARGVSAWVFAGSDWYVVDPQGPHVDHERHTVAFEPIVVVSFDEVELSAVGKIVGASDDFPHLAACETELQALLAGRAAAHRSQNYYLDVTSREATKGNFLLALSRRLGLAPAEIAVIGDMANDLSMFREAGFAIAMGNATDAVKAEADGVTEANTADGFAAAVERFVLPRAAAA